MLKWLKTWYHKQTHPICPYCKIEQDNVEFQCLWLSGECDTCYWKSFRKRRTEQLKQERENRINEMAEAIRRASPLLVRKVD